MTEDLETIANKILADMPSVKDGLDVFYGRQTVINGLKKALIIDGFSVAKRTLPSTYCKYCKKDPCERLNWSHPLDEFD